MQQWWDAVQEQGPDLLVGLIVAVLVWVLSRLLRWGSRRALRRTRLDPRMARVVARGVGTVWLVIGLVVAVSIMLPGVNLWAAFGTLGVGGVVAGFALRDILENLIAGVLILFTRPFSIGDQIVSGDAEGTVTDIQFRATVVRTYDNRAVVIPNSELYTNRVVVNTRYESVRHQVEITGPNTYPLEPIREAILEVLRTEERVLDAPPPEALVTALNDYSTAFSVRFWVGPPTTRMEITQTTDAVYTALFDRFGAMGLENIRPESIQYNAGELPPPARIRQI